MNKYLSIYIRLQNVFTYISDAHGCVRWLDHCVVTEDAKRTVVEVRVLKDVAWSDHLALEVSCDFDVLAPQCVSYESADNKVQWGERDNEQVDLFHTLCNERLKRVDFPSELAKCCDNMCSNVKHRDTIDRMYSDIISILSEAATKSCKRGSTRKRRHIVG